MVRRFPAFFDAIANGELHLTALLMLGPHLTPDDFREVLVRAKHQTKKEITRLVRELDPLPDVPPRIEFLGPTPTAGPRFSPRASWQDFMRSLNPIRHLAPGERPREWTCDELATLATGPALDPAGPALASPARSVCPGGRSS